MGFVFCVSGCFVQPVQKQGYKWGSLFHDPTLGTELPMNLRASSVSECGLDGSGFRASRMYGAK